MQYAMRHADPRTTMRDDMARANLDRHAAHAVAAYPLVRAPDDEPSAMTRQRTQRALHLHGCGILCR